MANINNSKEEINMPAEKKNGETKGVKGRHVFFYLLYRALIEGDFENNKNIRKIKLIEYIIIILYQIRMIMMNLKVNAFVKYNNK